MRAANALAVFRVYRRMAGPTRREFEIALVEQHGHGIQVGGVRLKLGDAAAIKAAFADIMRDVKKAMPKARILAAFCARDTLASLRTFPWMQNCMMGR